MKIVSLILLMMFVGCATKTKTKIVKVKEKPVRWSEKKRKCHVFYLDKFGLSTSNTIGICKEELERAD